MKTYEIRENWSKINGYTYKITSTSADNYLIQQDLVSNKSWNKAIWLK